MVVLYVYLTYGGYLQLENVVYEKNEFRAGDTIDFYYY